MRCIECEWFGSFGNLKMCNLTEEYLDETCDDCEKIDDEGNVDYSK